MKRNLIFLAGLMALLPATAAIASERVTYDVDASVGAYYDSSVGLSELDENTGTHDSAVKAKVGLAAKVRFTPRFSTRLSYDYGNTSYQRFDEFDLGLHHAAVDFGATTPHATFGLTLDRFDGVLAGDHYVTLSQVSPNVSHLFGSKLFVRAAWTGSRKNYDSLVTRDATNSAWRADSYVLFDGMRRHLAIGLGRGNEDAVADELDFASVRASLAYAFPIETSHLSMALKMRLRYESRDYRNATESIGEQRRDERLRFGLNARVPFSEHVALESDVDYSLHESNLESADVEKLVAGLKLSVSF